MNSFLNISNNPKNCVELFACTDTEKLFRKNLKRQDNDWIYRHKHIEYKNNEFGFRTKPIEKIDWANSIVVFGCSYVYGVGLAEEDTFCYLLEKKLNIPVVNLGMPGSAIDINHYNSMFLHENFPHPRAIVHCWTSIYRYTDFNENIVSAHVPKCPSYFIEINWAKKSQFAVYADRILWRNKVIYREYSLFPETSKTLKVSELFIPDKARDLGHPGIKSNIDAAERIAKDLRQQGI
jgi:hypothetical protein